MDNVTDIIQEIWNELVVASAVEAPLNRTPKPVTEKNAAHPAIISAENPTNHLSQFILSIDSC